MTKINNFDILKIMGERNMDIRLAPLSNVLNIQKVKMGTKVTIGIDGDIVTKFLNDGYVGGLILADANQFENIKNELEKKHDSR